MAFLTAAVSLIASCGRERLPVYSDVPDFELIERDGSTVRRADLEGRVWAADFIFTNCAGPCPRLSSHMADLQRALESYPEVRLVSFSVDPERDSPEVLTRYAARYAADPERWLFLTGGKQRMYDLIAKGFLLAVDDGSVAPGGEPGPGIITHSLKFALVDRQGRIRGYYAGEEADVVERMLPDVETLLGERR